MADNGNEYDVSRDSSVYNSAEISGHLEKKGVLGNRTKLWCSVQQSTLYMQKKQGDVMKTIDLKDCHLARKVTSEITGTHFEICEKKKTHVFICPTSANCTAWVKALQAAMALKDSGNASSDLNDSRDTAEPASVYETCDYNLNQTKNNFESPVKISSQYAEPYDVQKVSTAGNKENEYWEVGDVKSSLEKPLPPLMTSQPQNKSSSSQNHTKQVYEKTPTKGVAVDQSKDMEQTYTDAISISPTAKETPKVTPREAATVLRRPSASGTNTGYSNETYSDAPSAIQSLVQPVNNTAQSPVTITLYEPDQDTASSPDTEDDDSHFQVLQDALSNQDAPVPDYIHPLTEEDRKPVKDLVQFLNKNPAICDVPYSSIPDNEDPVSSLKSFLKTTGLISGLSGLK